MNLDTYGLPCQANGDRNDQLQRCGMVACASILVKSADSEVITKLERDCVRAIGAHDGLQPRAGTFVRYIGANPNNCSADQIISALCTMILITPKTNGDILECFLEMMFRLGFAQNTHDGLNSDAKWKLPDFMFFRAAPLFARSLPSPLAQICCAVVDLYLIITALGAILYGRQSPDNVDQNDTVMTLAICSQVKPSPWSVLASWMFGRFLPWNNGCSSKTTHPGNPPILAMDAFRFKPPFGALRWYHRAEAGGNPEIAEMWKPICDKLWGA